MDRQNYTRRNPFRAATVLRGLAAVVAATGLLAALGIWAVMATYADESPNTLLQNLTPLLVYALPAWIVALVLALIACRLDNKDHASPLT